MKLPNCIKRLFKGYKGRRHFGFTYRYPIDDNRPRVRVRIHISGERITK